MKITVWEMDIILQSGRVRASAPQYTPDRPISSHGPSVARNIENTLNEIRRIGNDCRIVALLDYETDDAVRRMFVVTER